MGIPNVQELTSERSEKIPERYIESFSGDLKRESEGKVHI